MGLVAEDPKNEKQNDQHNNDTLNIDSGELQGKSETINQHVLEPLSDPPANIKEG